MVSELDWEYLQIMRDIESKEAANQPEEPSQSPRAPWRIRPPSGRAALLIIILFLAVALLFAAYLAGFFGTTEGQRGIWRDAYRNQTEHLERKNSNLSRMLIAAQESGGEWMALARDRLLDLEKARSELHSSREDARRWESRCWEAELSLNGTLSELERVGGEREEWKTAYESTLGELHSLEGEHDRLKDELSSLQADIGEARQDKEVIQKQLGERSIELVRLQIAIGLLHLQLGKTEKEAEEWVGKFHDLELEYRDLLCELKFCRSENTGWEEVFEEQQIKLDSAWEELEACKTRTERILRALENARMENQDLQRLYDLMIAKLEKLGHEKERLLRVYRNLSQNHTLLLEEMDHLRMFCENQTRLLSEVESERDHWLLLFQKVSSQLSICSGEVDYWKGKYDSVLLQLEGALAEIQLLSTELDNCTQTAEKWMQLYQSTQVELAEALSEADYWRGLYMDLANITLDVTIDNLNVEERIGGKPSVVSADITVCVSNVDTPMLLLLEFWGEPVDCIWGYGSILEDVSEWTGNCKVFSVEMDFGTGVPPYKIVTRATLRPISGLALAEEEGPP